MERAEWLKKMRAQAEALYDHLAPAYWIEFGLYANAMHRQFVEKFVGPLGAHSAVLDAAFSMNPSSRLSLLRFV